MNSNGHKPNHDSHGLEAFRAPQEAGGISLEQLNAAFAQMLGQGSSPYAPPEASRAEPAQLGAPSLATEVDDRRGGEADALNVTPRGILEAALFVGNPDNEPLRPEFVAARMRGVRAAEIEDLVAELNAEYLANGCPYEIASVGAGYAMRIRPEHEAARDRYLHRRRRTRLSQAAVEVLSIVAYNQPTTIAEVDRLRGKSSSALLRQLVRRQLLAVERTPGPGRTSQYCTTDRFLDLFGLSNLEELPRPEDVERK